MTSPVEALRSQIEEDYKTACGHLDWLEGYMKRLASQNGQQVMPQIISHSPLPVVNGHRTEELEFEKAKIVDAAIKTVDPITTTEVIRFSEEKFGLRLDGKYVGTRLSRLSKKGRLDVIRPSVGGEPTIYGRRGDSTHEIFDEGNAHN